MYHSKRMFGFFPRLLVIAFAACSLMACGMFAAASTLPTLTTPIPIDSPTLTSTWILVSPTQTAAPSSSPTALLLTVIPDTQTATATIQPLTCLPDSADESYGLVQWVSSGSSIVVDIQGKLQSVRYLGIQEAGRAVDSSTYGPPAATQNALLVDGKVVRLISDGPDQDDYGRWLRYVVVYGADTFVNFELLRAGLAQQPPDAGLLACSELFLSAEQFAQEAQLGMWAATPTALTTIPIPPTRTPNLTPSITLTASRTTTPIPATFTSTPTATRTATITGTPPTATPSLTASLTPTFTPSPIPATATEVPTATTVCDISYLPLCIPPPPPDLNCSDIPYTNFAVEFPDPHNFDSNGNGIGCEPGDP